ncbi:hypothetical protein RCH09_003985, partial [Actimicrobium sp. GrIS 1.19]|uniref:hypothetical protein n=1 Tax=Actimicrobium sp. GrIS 1.19 TaxID=3071708 RepID=UPI002E01B363|nr:hypothetical protein [Actimicrobium sp. GrIS 1.19]
SGCTTLRLVIVFLVAGSLLPNDRLHKIIYTPGEGLLRALRARANAKFLLELPLFHWLARFS